MSAPASVNAGVQDNLPVTEALAVAMVQALLDSDSLGVALVRDHDLVHVLTNAAYDSLVGGRAVGRTLHDVLPEEIAPRRLLENVARTGKVEHVHDVLVRTQDANTSTTRIYASFTYLRVPRLSPDAGGILVLAQDVSKEVHERRMGDLFVLLARDMTAERDEAATIRSSVAHATRALGADAASIFLMSPDEKSLHGALVGWDWTRSSFGADIDEWPNVKRVIATNRPAYFTAVEARNAEEGWFERRGIKAAVCAPMAVDDRVCGVLFFDYQKLTAQAVDLDLAKSVADQCALLVERAALRVGA